MINKLRRRFILASLLALAVVLLVILGGINCMNYRKTVSDADAILSVLADNGGLFPQRLLPGGEDNAREELPEGAQRVDALFRRHGLSVETPYESRFFSVRLSEEGTPLSADTGRIAAVDALTAQSYAQRVWESGRSRGFLEDYRFVLRRQDGAVQVIFLDCGRSLSNFRTVLLASAAVSLAGLAAVGALLLIFSRRIVKPVAESYEKQRQFITDAGHEIKTPLTIIGADADLLELEGGKSEWLTDIQRQAGRLAGLTDELIYLSRMEEERPPLQCIEFPLSDVVEESVQSFQALARAGNKSLTAAIPPLLSWSGDEKALRQLLSLLLDNAVKYSPEGGEIFVTLERESRGVRLSVSNTTAQAVDKEQLGHFFDRFYRADPSRKAGGYGLGLSIARSIVAAHRGKIRAESDGKNRLTICVTLPL